MPKRGKYRLNDAGDGYMPVCGNCEKAFPDAEIGTAKNYPDDGLVAVFFECGYCGEESVHYYQPYEGDIKER
ncbi:MAG: hypothetical protein AB1402_03125 [Bacillota bacterium]